MKLELPTPDGHVLEITLSGSLSGIVRASSSGGVALGAGSTAPAIPAGSPGLKRRKATVRKVASRATAPAPMPQEHIEAALTPAEPGSPETEVPPEFVGIPQKQLDFFQRKLTEFQEIYDADKARRLAIEMLQRVVGHKIG